MAQVCSGGSQIPDLEFESLVNALWAAYIIGKEWENPI